MFLGVELQQWNDLVESRALLCNRGSSIPSTNEHSISARGMPGNGSPWEIVIMNLTAHTFGRNMWAVFVNLDAASQKRLDQALR